MMKTRNLVSIPVNKAELWRLILKRGETIYNLSKASGLYDSTLANVLKHGKAHTTTISKLAKFFNVATSTRKKILLRKG